MRIQFDELAFAWANKPVLEQMAYLAGFVLVSALVGVGVGAPVVMTLTTATFSLLTHTLFYIYNIYAYGIVTINEEQNANFDTEDSLDEHFLNILDEQATSETVLSQSSALVHKTIHAETGSDVSTHTAPATARVIDTVTDTDTEETREQPHESPKNKLSEICLDATGLGSIGTSQKMESDAQPVLLAISADLPVPTHSIVCTQEANLTKIVVSQLSFFSIPKPPPGSTFENHFHSGTDTDSPVSSVSDGEVGDDFYMLTDKDFDFSAHR